MAAPPNPNVHLEAVEEAQNESEELDTTGDSRMAGEGCKQLPESLLAHGKKWPYPKGNLERKTRTGGILQHP